MPKCLGVGDDPIAQAIIPTFKFTLRRIAINCDTRVFRDTSRRLFDWSGSPGGEPLHPDNGGEAQDIVPDSIEARVALLMCKPVRAQPRVVPRPPADPAPIQDRM